MEFEYILEDLGGGLKIYQSDKLYKFTTDAIALANFVPDQTNKKVVELGSGSGVISILLASVKNAKSVVAVEVQKNLAEMSQKSVEINNLNDKITIVNLPMQNINKTIGDHFDTVVCNPPYRKVGSGEKQLEDTIAICRHEILVTLAEVVETASILLNSKGSFYIVHQSERLAEVCYLMKQFDIEPKQILPIAPNLQKEPNLVIVRGVKHGNVGCKLMKTHFVEGEK